MNKTQVESTATVTMTKRQFDLVIQEFKSSHTPIGNYATERGQVLRKLERARRTLQPAHYGLRLHLGPPEPAFPEPAVAEPAEPALRQPSFGDDNPPMFSSD